jgi:hypothetical protein
MMDVESQVRKYTHIKIRNPDKGEQRDEIPTPIGIEQFESGDHQEKYRDVVTEAVFTRKQIEEFTLQEPWGRVTFRLAEFSGLLENVFMRHGPGNTRNWDGQNEQPQELRREGKHSR